METLRQHWSEYLMEAWGLGMFMISAGLVVALLEYPGSPLHPLLPDADLRRALTGLAMGLTAVGIIYSPWGQQSGAQINPAVTLAFLRLGKIAPLDALFYILAQFAGGTLGVLLVLLLLGEAFSLPPVNQVATVPGAQGPLVAFLAEFAISLGLMLTVLFFMNSQRLGRLTGLAAGILVATYIILEAPLSGMSMNPARTFASAAPGGPWTHAWIYYTAPILGMLAAVELYRLLRRDTRRMCAKLDHPDHVRCIHCGYEPPEQSLNP
ncbi:MAG: aquaporin [Candidatus Thiodiazotropha sp. (ex Epidulcina cf. delphinae)]|nr:aquaporin [Candidatus Thiodiazotropha sp. (ex Epidulcina cf. delphinae)]